MLNVLASKLSGMKTEEMYSELKDLDGETLHILAHEIVLLGAETRDKIKNVLRDSSDSAVANEDIRASLSGQVHVSGVGFEQRRPKDRPIYPKYVRIFRILAREIDRVVRGDCA